MANGKNLKKMIIVLGILILALATFGAVEYTSQTDFCNSCHEMNTAFAGWDTGVHQTVHCYGCHTDEGIIAKAKIKANGLREVYLHLTQDINMDEVEADVPASRCNKCHDMTDAEKYGERVVNFHSQHEQFNFDCLTCHKSAGHTKNYFDGFKNDACKQCHLADKQAG